MKGVIPAAAVLLLAMAPGPAGAFTVESHDAHVTVSGFLDLQYTFMGRLPMGVETAPGVFAVAPVPQDTISTLDQDRLNVILKADRDRFRADVNVASRKAYAAGGVHPRGEFSILEAYGEYQVSDAFRVRGGSFLVPFGIYNEIRYATSLFAPVVLPQLYETLPNYQASGGADHVVPEEGNLMVLGTVGPGGGRFAYAAYVGTGDRTEAGIDRNENKALGGRLTLLLDHGRQEIGGSYYTTDEGGAWGRRQHTIVSLDLRAGPWGLEAESLWMTTSRDRADVFSYYVRLRREMGPATPFVGFDYFEDGVNPVYAEGMQRWSGGLGYDVTPYLYVKGEYHFHDFDGAAIPSGAEHVHMLRLAAILVF